MDKKVIKAMYSKITSDEDNYPVMKGIHFEKDRCYASDSHVLIVYREGGNEKFSGKTVSRSGEELKGKFPSVDSVLKRAGHDCEVHLHLSQLLKALKWWGKQKGRKNDAVCINKKCISMDMLERTFSVFDSAGELGKTRIFLNLNSMPVYLESKSLSAILMPKLFNEEDVDDCGEDKEIWVVSIMNLINTYVFESSKTAKKEEEFNWL